jgi:hypothetical protein
VAFIGAGLQTSTAAAGQAYGGHTTLSLVILASRIYENGSTAKHMEAYLNEQHMIKQDVLDYLNTDVICKLREREMALLRLPHTQILAFGLASCQKDDCGHHAPKPL